MSDQVVLQINQKNVSGMIQQVVSLINKGLFKGAVEVVLRRPKRSLSQNAKMWPMLKDVQIQVNWYDQPLDNDDWKNMFMSSLNKQRAVPGIDGGFVGLSKSTKKLNKAEFSQLIELIYAFGANNNVAWSEQALQTYSKYREQNQ